MQDIDSSFTDAVLVISDLSDKIYFGNEISPPFRLSRSGLIPGILLRGFVKPLELLIYFPEILEVDPIPEFS
jgi:hypothetical protein